MNPVRPAAPETSVPSPDTNAPSPDTNAPSPDTCRIAYIMSRFPKLTETFVLYEILTMEAEGVAVEVYPLLRERQPVSHPEAEKWLRRVRFHPFVSPAILRAHLHFIRRKPKAYFGTLRDVVRGTWGSVNFFIGALGIFPKVVRFAYEMQLKGVEHVHAHFATHPALAGFIIRRLTGIPYSFTAHGSDLHVDRRMLDAKVAEAAFAVTVSSYNREVMIGSCGEASREKIRVVHCGVDTKLFRPSDETLAEPREDSAFRILCVASFEEVKGHRYLLEACDLLGQRGVDYRCELVGDGPLRGRVEAGILDRGLRGRVRVAGPRPRPEVVRMLKGADAVALASHPTPEGKREGIPVALMEAMASGVPVVSTAISGIPELVDSGRDGILVPSGDAVALADALERLARDDGLRARMGAAGRARVLREFDLHTNTLKLLGLFRTSLRGSGTGVVRGQCRDVVRSSAGSP